MPCSESLTGGKSSSVKGGVSTFLEVLYFLFFIFFGLALSYDGIV